MRRPTAAVVLLTAAAAAAPPAAAHAAPLGVHAIFAGGARAPFHAGQPVQVSLTGADRRGAVTSACWTPAPLGRPSCAGRIAAPAAAGRQRVVVTLADGSTRTTSFVVRTARTRYDGRVAALSHVTCVSTTAYTNIGLRPGGPTFRLTAGTPVARYGQEGRGVAVWAYAAGKVGFLKAGCLAPGPA